MRLLKIVAIPAAISLLLTPADATEAKARSKILGKIQKNMTNKSLAQASAAEADKCDGECPPCHEKFQDHPNCHNEPQPKYNPEDFKGLHYPDFEKKAVHVDYSGSTNVDTNAGYGSDSDIYGGVTSNTGFTGDIDGGNPSTWSPTDTTGTTGLETGIPGMDPSSWGPAYNGATTDTGFVGGDSSTWSPTTYPEAPITGGDSSTWAPTTYPTQPFVGGDSSTWSPTTYPTYPAPGTPIMGGDSSTWSFIGREESGWNPNGPPLP
jgi:hypothetical protein